MEIEKLSVGNIGIAKRCEKALKYTLTLPKPEKLSVYLFMGQIFHACLEEYFKRKAFDPKDIVSLFDLLGMVKFEFDRGQEKIDWKKLDKLKALNMVKTYLTLYYNKRCGFLVPEDTESTELYGKFKVKLEDEYIWVSYKVDLIVKGHIIVDHKTSSQGWSQDEANKEMQAHLYPIGIIANGRSCNGFEFDVVTKDSFNVYPVQRNMKVVEDTFKYLIQLKRAFRTDNLTFSHSKYVCGMCDFKNICTFKSV